MLNGKMYANSEQTIQVAKAVMFDDDKCEQLIMQTSNPSKAKAIGNSIRRFNQQRWERDCKSLVRSICLAKFQQNEKCKEFLLGTGNKVIVEATKDRFRGCRKRVNDYDLLESQQWN